MTLDSGVVYLNVALPAGLRTHLPPLTENWKDFIHDQRWQRRWVAESKQDRRQVPRDLIASISRDDPQPTLYFAHSLLPHEPYVYLRSGQEFTGDPRLVGLNQVGRWTTDSWPVTLAYRRHLLQVEYVDAVVGSIIERLTAEGLYDAALIVVTSDHGVSFRPGQYFKGFSAANLADIMSVPLLIKAPHQRRGRIDDSNIQSVDVMPTIASLLNVKLTWTPEGRAAGTGVDPAHQDDPLRRRPPAGHRRGRRPGGKARCRGRPQDRALRRSPGMAFRGGQPRRSDRPARGRTGRDRRALAGARGRRGSVVLGGPGQPTCTRPADGPRPRCPRRTRGCGGRHRGRRHRHGRDAHVPARGCSARLVGRGGESGAVCEGPERSPRVCAAPERGAPAPGVLVAHAARPHQSGVSRRAGILGGEAVGLLRARGRAHSPSVDDWRRRARGAT